MCRVAGACIERAGKRVDAGVDGAVQERAAAVARQLAQSRRPRRAARAAADRCVGGAVRGCEGVGGGSGVKNAAVRVVV